MQNMKFEEYIIEYYINIVIKNYNIINKNILYFNYKYYINIKIYYNNYNYNINK